MYSIRSVDEYICNSYMDVALKLFTNTIFAGDYNRFSGKNRFFEIWLLQSQHCNINTTTGSHTIYQGDILVFSQNDNMEITNSDVNARFLTLQIDPVVFFEFLPACTNFDAHSFFKSHSSNFKNKISASSPVGKAINGIFRIILEIFSEKRSGYEFEIVSNSISIILTISRETNYISEAYLPEVPDKFNKASRSLKKAITYIDTHLSEELTLEKISAVVELSPNYLSNIFRFQTGMRLWDYIGEKRIQLATQLLIENPNDSIISIALKCGFNNCPNFNRTFKKFTGQTPKKYKTSILRQEELL